MNAASVKMPIIIGEEVEKYLKEGNVIAMASTNVHVKVLHKESVNKEKVFNIYLNGKIYHSGKQFNTLIKKLKRLIVRNNLQMFIPS